MSYDRWRRITTSTRPSGPSRPITCPRASWNFPVPPVTAETTLDGTESKMPAVVIWSA
jgi:hypothetical protein